MADVSPSPPRLSPRQVARIRRLSGPADANPGEAGELNVVPYLDIIMNVTMFVLATVSLVFVSSVDTTAAVRNSGEPYKQASRLGLTVLITDGGVALKTSAGNVASGCDGLGPGITVPLRDAKHDLSAITACARKLKTASPEFAEETEVALSASPGVDYATVISVMDALRRDRDAVLFPDVHLAVVR
jgi:biopolymer transport protein TolR